MLDRESIYNFLKRIDAEIELNDRIVKSFPIEKNGCEEGSVKIYHGGYIRFFGLGPPRREDIYIFLAQSFIFFPTLPKRIYLPK
jgi:hypothetical protein